MRVLQHGSPLAATIDYLEMRQLLTIDLVSAVAPELLSLTGNEHSFEPVLSADGSTLAFSSSASNLVVGDLNITRDIFVKDLASGTITLASVTAAGGQADSGSTQPSSSADGTKLAFASSASNLVAGDTNRHWDVFVKDLTTGTITRVSTSAAGVETDNSSLEPILSRDGTKVAFLSSASNLVPGDTNGVVDVFVKNLTTGSITRVSAAPSGVQGNGNSFPQAFDAAGTNLVFVSDASTLVAGDTNNTRDVFVKNFTTGSITRVSTSSTGSQSNNFSNWASLSDDGTKVVFTSDATNFVQGDTNESADLFVKDLTTGTITRVNTDAFGRQGNADCSSPLLSADGTKVAFSSYASNLVPGDTNNQWDVFVKDLTTGAIRRVSTNASGRQGNNFSSRAAVSPDWTKFVFESYATNLVAEDTNQRSDVFLKDLTTGATEAISVPVISQYGGNESSSSPSLNVEGTKVAFESDASNLVAGDTNAKSDVFVRDLTTGVTTRVSTNRSGLQGNAASSHPVLSADGAKLAFVSDATNLVAGDTNALSDVFVKDLATGSIIRVSTGLLGVQANGNSSHPVLNAAGTKVAFESDASNLVDSDTNGTRDVFVKDLKTGLITRVSMAGPGLESNGASSHPSLSADGATVAFESDASNLVHNDANGLRDVFVKDLTTGLITRASTIGPGLHSNNRSSYPALSADGTKVAFESDATNLAETDTNQMSDIFVKDLKTGTLDRISVGPSGSQGNAYSFQPALNTDGTKVAFRSAASNFVPGDRGYEVDIFVKDLGTGAIKLVSENAFGQQSNRSVSQPALSSDGNKVAFSSDSTNLHPGDKSLSSDVYLVTLDGLPFDVALSSQQVAENTVAGAVVGILTTTHANASGSFTYSLVAGGGDADNSSFRIVGNQLQTGMAFNFETRSSYVVRVRTTDASGSWFEKAFAINVTDVNEAPTLAFTNVIPSLDQRTDVSSRVRIADIVITDDALDKHSLAVAATSAGEFEIIGRSLYLKPGTILNAALKPSFSYTIRVSDGKFVVRLTGSLQISATVPTISAPAPVTDEMRPVFTWTAIPGAVRYEITVRELLLTLSPSSKLVEVTDGGSTVSLVNYSVSGTSYTPPSDLGIGRFNYWVRAVDAAGVKSAWSPTYTFNVMTAVAINPISNIRQAVARPTISWQPLPGAVRYDVWVDNTAMTPAIAQYVRTEVTGTSWTPSSDLPMGSYRIWLRGVDEVGAYRRWSAFLDFVVVPAPALTEISSTFNRTPTFQWSAIAGAQSYEIVVTNAATGAEMFRQTATGTNATPLTDLPVGSYRWQVRAIGAGGYSSDFSAGSPINVGGRPVTMPVVVKDGVPTFSWLSVQGAASYQIRVDRLDVPTANVINTSNLTATTRTHTTSLTAGRYRFWVRAISTSPIQTSANSAFIDFTVTDVLPPEKAWDGREQSQTILTSLPSPFSSSSSRPAMQREQKAEVQDGVLHNAPLFESRPISPGGFSIFSSVSGSPDGESSEWRTNEETLIDIVLVEFGVAGMVR